MKQKKVKVYLSLDKKFIEAVCNLVGSSLSDELWNAMAGHCLQFNEEVLECESNSPDMVRLKALFAASAIYTAAKKIGL